MKRTLLFIFLLLLVFFSVPTSLLAAVRMSSAFVSYPRQGQEFVAAVVMVPATQQVLYAFQADLPHPAASLTKLPNALAFLRRKVPMSRAASILAADEVGGGRLRVSAGARMTVQDLFYSSITASANNAAVALARISGLKSAAFLRAMNEEARLAGATSSHFVDFAGMDPKNITTAHDIALIADRAFANPVIRRAATVFEYAFRFVEKKRTLSKTIKNTNDLLTKDPEMWVLGGKTGYLEEAKNNLVVRLRALDEHGKPKAGTDIIVVVLGAETKAQMFAAAKSLAQWTWNNHEF